MNVRGQLYEVEAALHRFDTGVFGRCERCGEAIYPARLKALPWARYCLGCQHRVEQARTS